jgi:hypothetical protein
MIERIREFWNELRELSLPIVLAAFAGALFWLPGQTLEIYRTLSQFAANTDWQKWRSASPLLTELSLAVLGIAIVSLALWYIARRIASVSEWQAAKGQNVESQFAARSWQRLWLPRLLVMVVPLAATMGVFAAGVDPEFDERVKKAIVGVFAEQYQQGGLGASFASRMAGLAADRVLSFSTYLNVFALALAALSLVLLSIVVLIDGPRLARFLALPPRWFRYLISAVSILGISGIIAAFTLHPITIPQAVGALFIMCLFLFMLQLTLYHLLMWERQTSIPFTAFLIGLAVIFAVLGVNDNHHIRTLATDKTDIRRDPTLTGAFAQWMASRQDLQRYKDQPYPIYIVAAQGGGIYAAKHVASFLGELQDLCPGFGHHLFAISGVSGGSVGASVFASLSRELDVSQLPASRRLGCVQDLKAKRITHFTDAVSEVFDADLWSPLAAGMLFPDFLQRFLPVPIERWDRARALEGAIEHAYDIGVRRGRLLPKGSRPKNMLTAAYLDHWDAERHPNTPALALNTTEVVSGRRLVVSPFSFSGVGLRFLPVWAMGKDGRPAADRVHLPLSTAAGLSARFPWVTPSAFYREAVTEAKTGKTRRQKISLVDGGYFENSGVVTAIDMIRSMVKALRTLKLNQQVEINLLVFTSAEFNTGAASSAMSEVLDPIRTLFSTGSARAGIAVGEALGTLSSLSSSEARIKSNVVKLELKGYGYPLPLGWRLSPVTRHLISHHNGSELKCDAAAAARFNANQGQSTASCAKWLVYERLK